MAHALFQHDGACSNIHGHSYRLYVTVSGIPLNSPGHPKDGMVADFKDIKKLVKEQVISVFDHALVLNEKTPGGIATGLKKMYEKTITKTYQPTCENLLLDIVATICSGLPDGLDLFSVKLFETVASFAEWYAEDNEPY